MGSELDRKEKLKLYKRILILQMDKAIGTNRSRGSVVGIIAFLMALLMSAGLYAQNPASLPNPNLGNPDNYVCDPQHQLAPGTVSYVNKTIAEVRRKTTAEIAVAVVNNLDGMEVQDYAYELFRHWGLGKKDKNNGVLLLIARGDRKCFIQVGSGLEGVLPDISCANIINRFIIPPLRNGKNLNQAVAGGVNEIALVISDPAVAEEVKSNLGSSATGRFESLDSEVFMEFIILVVGCVFLFTLILFIIDLTTTRKRDNYRRAMTWKSHMGTYWWGVGLSLGLALPITLLAYWMYRRARDVKEICDTCGAKMNKLSEVDDNAFLSDSQDFEEKLGTVDYDVWLCPDCGTVARFPYVEKQLKYKKCPSCQTIAMNLVMDKVVVPATTTRQGHGERLYECQYCHHKQREGYVIPKKSNDAAILGAMAAGAMLGGRSGGGGGFGGGFGGGSTSGGGAGGSW